MTNVRALTITGLLMAGLIYIVCAAFVAIAPEAALKIGTYITHLDLGQVGRTVTWGGALVGFAFVTVFVAVVCAASGAIYNRLAAGQSETKEASAGIVGLHLN